MYCFWCTKRKVKGKYDGLCMTHKSLYNRQKYSYETYMNLVKKYEDAPSEWLRKTLDVHEKYLKMNTSKFHLYNNVNMFRHEICIKKIQRAWRRCITDPTYNMCRVRLNREFEIMKFNY